mgnify:CR=1 FL=1
MIQVKNISRNLISIPTIRGTVILHQGESVYLTEEEYVNSYSFISSLVARSMVAVMDHESRLSKVESIANLALSIARS